MAKLYGSVNGQSKEIKKLYGSIGGYSKLLKKLYGSVNGQTKLIYQNYGEIVYYTDDTYTTVAAEQIVGQTEISSLCNMASSWSASINGVSILNTRIKEVDLSRSDLTTLDNGFLRGCTKLESVKFPPSLTTLGALSLTNCTSLNSPIVIPNTVTTIPAGFMSGCTSFNSAITLPTGLTNIEGNAFSNLTSFNQPFNIPSTVTAIGINFVNNWDSMVSPINVGTLSTSIFGATSNLFVTANENAPCYTTGIPIAGANRAAWLTALPDLTSSGLYRHLVDAGT